MTCFPARADGEPVSFKSFSLSIIFARVNEQQFSMTIFTVLLTSGIHGITTMRIMEWNGLGLRNTCQVYLPSHLQEQLFNDKYACSKSWYASF